MKAHKYVQVTASRLKKRYDGITPTQVHLMITGYGRKRLVEFVLEPEDVPRLVSELKIVADAIEAV